MTSAPTLDIRSARIGAVLNTASGSCSVESAEEMEAILKEFNPASVRIWCSDSDHLPEAFKEVKKRDLDVLVVLGGDGTIRSAAELCTTDGPYLIPLPGGTMNVLPKALYGNRTWQEILRDTLASPEIKRVSAGILAGHRFFIAAICGAPALWTHVREALRTGSFSEAIEHGKVAFTHMFEYKIRYRFNEMHEGETEAIMVTCPLVSDALEDDRKVFEAAVIDVNSAGEVLSLATATAFGEWRDTQQVAIVRTDRVSVSGKDSIPVILDGESVDIGPEATIEFIEEAFDALVPRHEVLP